MTPSIHRINIPNTSPWPNLLLLKGYLDSYCNFLRKGFILTFLKMANCRPVSDLLVLVLAEAQREKFGPVVTRSLKTDGH